MTYKFNTHRTKTNILSLIITILLILFVFMQASGQTMPKDTTKLIPIHYTELVKINLQLQKAVKLYHSFDVPALKRDTLDNYLNDISYFLNRRGMTVYADTLKKKQK